MKKKNFLVKRLARNVQVMNQDLRREFGLNPSADPALRDAHPAAPWFPCRHAVGNGRESGGFCLSAHCQLDGVSFRGFHPGCVLHLDRHRAGCSEIRISNNKNIEIMKKNKKNCERPTIDFELSTKDMLEVMVKGTAVSCKLVKILTNSGSGHIGISAAFYGLAKAYVLIEKLALLYGLCADRETGSALWFRYGRFLSGINYVLGRIRQDQGV